MASTGNVRVHRGVGLADAGDMPADLPSAD